MDILSFILGLKKGKNSIKLQEKTVTPGTQEQIVVPGTGFDALSKVIVEAAQSSGGSGEWIGASGQFSPTSTTQIINHDLGVVPDIVFILYNSWGSITGTTNAVLMIGAAFSKKLLGESLANGSSNNELYYGFSMSYRQDTKMFVPSTVTTPLEELTVSHAVGIGDVTDTTVTFGSTSNLGLLHTSGNGYQWHAYART